RAAGFRRDDTPEQKRSRLDVLLAPGAIDGADLTLIAELLSLPNDAAALGVNSQQKRAMLFQALLHQLDAVFRTAIGPDDIRGRALGRPNLARVARSYC